MQSFTTSLIAAGILLTGGLSAQTTIKEEKKEIIIEQKAGSKKEKMVIEIDGPKVTINGKPAEDYKGTQRIIIDDDIIINGNSVVIPGKKGTASVKWSGDSRPILGVMTEKDDNGVRINSVNKETGAEKAGLKEGDIITMINKTAVSSPEELTEAIRKNKIGDEIEVTFLRNGKTQKTKATLGKGNQAFVVEGEDFNFNFNDNGGPYAFTMPRMPRMDPDGYRNLMIYGSDRPKYGMGIQDDEDGRGVKVTDVENESNAAKGGLKKDDIITEVDGEKVSNVDQMREKLSLKKDAPTVAMKVLRNDKAENLTIRVPRKLKTANL